MLPCMPHASDADHDRSPPSSQITEDVEREILNHRLLDHENIVRFHEVPVCGVHV